MAKLKAPLLSLGASGAIGKAIVYFGWKGLNVAREYVIPSNPKTKPQQDQRGYLTAAVAAIHAAQALPAPLSETDIMAYALLGSTRPTPRTWFNEIVKQWLNQKVAEQNPDVMVLGFSTPGDKKLDVGVWGTIPPADTQAKFYYGTSKTALVRTVAAAFDGGEYHATIPNLTNGVKYFWIYKAELPVENVGKTSGIYYGVPKAP